MDRPRRCESDKVPDPDGERALVRRAGDRAGERMSIYRATAEINAPVERVWEAYSAVESWPQWLPTVEKIEAFDGAPLKLGARFRVIQPKLKPVVWTVNRLEPPLRFTWRSTSPGVEMVADHVLERVEPAGTRAHLSFEFKGWLGGLLGVAFGAITREYVEKEARALTQRAEAGS